jgi:putative (di)nucleoside polyphosphate hydrolase
MLNTLAMRLFVGIELAPLLRQQIVQATGHLRRQIRGKWVEQHNLHVTVGFIGELPQSTLTTVKAALHKAVINQPAFDMYSDKIVGWPKFQARLLLLPIVIPQAYISLRDSVVRSFKQARITLKTNHPHITLVRLKNDLRNFPEQKLPHKVSIPVNQISLIQSTLTAKGPIYKAIAGLKLTPVRRLERFRPNIAICLINPKNEVLLVKHKEHIKEYWQFPQGGINAGDNLQATIRRELKEELGLSQFSILKILENIYAYRWPHKLIKYGTDPSKRGYIGQIQSLAIVRVNEIRPKLVPDPREAAAVRWMKKDEVIKALNPIRRKVGRLAMLELSKLMAKTTPYGSS